MTSNINANIIPITDYISIKAELEYWREKFYGLQAQISELKQANNNTIIIKEGGQSKYVRRSDIIMLEAESNYTVIHFINGQKILTSKTLKHWMAQIGDHPEFIRPHRSFLVNNAHIISYQRHEKCLILTNGLTACVARRFKLL